MKPLVKIKGINAKDADLAINIYTGCPHKCEYCVAHKSVFKTKEEFSENVAPRKDIVEALKEQISKEGITGKTVLLCPHCDPYPHKTDNTVTREVIKVLKQSGNNVVILTKGIDDIRRDLDLLTKDDTFGVTIDGLNRNATVARINMMQIVHKMGIKTWVAFEPVIQSDVVLQCTAVINCNFVDKVTVNCPLNFETNTDWKEFSRKFDEIASRNKLSVEYKDALALRTGCVY